MSILHFDTAEVQLKKYAASTTSGSKKTTSTIRIELVTADPYALANILRQLDEIETEQEIVNLVARQAAKGGRVAPRQPRLTATDAPLLVPYQRDSR